MYQSIKAITESKNDERIQMPGFRGHDGEINLERADEAILRKTFNFLLRFFCFVLIFGGKKTPQFFLYTRVNYESVPVMFFKHESGNG